MKTNKIYIYLSNELVVFWVAFCGFRIHARRGPHQISKFYWDFYWECPIPGPSQSTKHTPLVMLTPTNTNWPNENFHKKNLQPSHGWLPHLCRLLGLHSNPCLGQGQGSLCLVPAAKNTTNQVSRAWKASSQLTNTRLFFEKNKKE